MKVIIVGAGGFGRQVHAYAGDCGTRYEVIGFADANPRALDGFEVPVPVLADVCAVDVRADTGFVIAVGDPVARRRLAAVVTRRGGRLVSLVHPTAYVSADARLGAGCVLCPFTFVGVAARVGANTVLNIYSSVGHDAVVGDHCVFSPYATINGGVRLEDEVYLGTKATVSPRLHVGAGAKLSAGAVVTRTVPAGGLAVGNPATSRVLFTPGSL